VLRPTSEAANLFSDLFSKVPAAKPAAKPANDRTDESTGEFSAERVDGPPEAKTGFRSGHRAGQMQANVDSVDVVVRGKGGHGAAPHATVDPVVLAARVVLDLQAIVSREKDPLQPAFVTVGSIHGGTKHNIIPDEVKLQLTVRTTTDASRKQTLEAVERVVKAAAEGAGAPEPEVKVDAGGFTPALVNDPALTDKTVALFKEALGAERVHERPMSLGGDDFSQFIRAGVPGFYFFLGSAPPGAVAEARRGGKPLPLTHSDSYYPVPEPTIKTGVLTMTHTTVLPLSATWRNSSMISRSVCRRGAHGSAT
jgi:hippurate hydrolase